MEEAGEALKKANEDLEALENSEATNRELEKAKAKIRIREADKAKACNKYFESVQAEKNTTSIEADISVLEDLEEDLEQEEQSFTSESLKAIRKRKV